MEHQTQIDRLLAVARTIDTARYCWVGTRPNKAVKRCRRPVIRRCGRKRRMDPPI
jgi:hypothetical protein